MRSSHSGRDYSHLPTISVVEFLSEKVRRVFFEVQSDLPRQGPGNREATAGALILAQPLPARPRILDIGCGPGMQTLHLAELLPDARIVALDLHEQYLDELRREVEARALDERIEIVPGDMGALPFAPASFDLVWCEGAAYILGLERALKTWRPLLADNGRIAISEATWFRPDPPAEVRRFWDEGYPAMAGVAANVACFETADFDVLGHFSLPDAAWWEDYYTPLEARLVPLRAKYEGDEEALAVIESTQQEIELFRRHSAFYGYTFFVAAKKRGDD